jgi:hypothetical protein
MWGEVCIWHTSPFIYAPEERVCFGRIFLCGFIAARPDGTWSSPEKLFNRHQ